MSTIGSNTPVYGPSYTGGPAAMGGGSTVNNASGYYGQGAGTAGQVASGLNNFVQGGSQLLGFPGGSGGGGDSSGGSGSSINPMPKFNSPILAKAQSNQSSQPSGELSASGGSTKKLASIFDDDGGGDYSGGGEASE